MKCNYQTENARFLLECDFSKQYSHYYRKRLEKTRPFLEFNCRSKWDPRIPLYGLAELASLVSSLDSPEPFGEISPSQSSLGSMSPESGPSSYYKFAKRMRKYSSSSRDRSPHPKTSTQLAGGGKPFTFDKECFEGSPKPTSSDIESPVGSPIVPVTKQQIVYSGGNAEKEKKGQENELHPNSNYCIVIGTIFKRMKLQPDVVRELSHGDFHVNCERYLGHYTSQDDKLVLEDEDESISLTGNIDPKKFVTGITVALLGESIDDASHFFVRDICYAEPNSQILYEDLSQVERPLQQLANTEPIYLMVVSGLGFHQDMGKNEVLIKALQDMIDFVWGAEKYSEDERSSRVSRILVAGDSLLESRLIEPSDSSQEGDLALKMKQSRQVKPFKGSIQAVKHMDDFFAQLSKTIEVHVMPGPSDPSSHLMPQQPFHPCMFPKSCMFSTFNCTTNPHHAIYNDNVEILATAGQNIDIISKFSGIKDTIEIMKCHLMWGNSAPSAPDNLYSVPYEDDDPHVIEFIPEVYIAGNQESYRTDFYYYSSGELGSSTTTTPEPTSQQQPLSSDKSNVASYGKKKRTLLVTIPRFNETYSCVLINLKNLESHLLSFR